MIAQAAIFLLSTASIWLLSAKQPNRWGYVLGLCSQPFWLYASARGAQWGVFALALVYVVVWARGIRNHWLQWDEWRGAMDGRPTMFIWHVVEIFGYRVDLHQFVDADDPGCFHTHPAYAVRLVLRGGYIEELEDGRTTIWSAGRFGLVHPELSHRVAGVMNGRSAYTLWLRGPKCADIVLRGDGWPAGSKPA